VSEAATPAVGAASKLRAFLELGKFRLSSLAVFAVVAGIWLGTSSLREPDAGLVVVTTLGTFLVAIGGSALNMFLERIPDARMERTKGRPLPTGRLAPHMALWFGLATIGCGLVLLLLRTNLLAAMLCATIAVTYVAVYTPLKRVTTFNTLVGAVPGALPPVVGYAAATGRIDLRALVLFMILFFWQIPHFLAIAWRHRHDYERGGMKMLPLVDPHGRTTAVQMIVYTLALIVTSLYAWQAKLASELYLVAALLLGLALLAPVLLAAHSRSDLAMRRCFLATIAYLPLLLGVMMIDRV